MANLAKCSVFILTINKWALSLFNNEDFDLHRLTGTIIYHLKENRSLALQYYHHIAGKNTGQGWGLTGGVVFECRR